MHLMLLDYENSAPDPVTGARPLGKESAASMLGKIVRQCPSKHVLFDLDSTLLDNRPRSAQIMREFAEQVHEPMLASAQPAHFQDWNASHAMANMGLAANAIDRLLQPYEAFWFERFFSSEYCAMDQEIPGAISFANQVRDAGATVYYLTGRDEAMREGTLMSFERLGFPMPDTQSVDLIMKPTRDYSDDAFKQERLQSLNITQQLVAAFDNEPTHINTYRELFPDAVCVHLHTDHSMRPVRLLDNIYSISNYG